MNKKTLAIILACLMMLLPAFASCANDPGTTGPGGTTGGDIGDPNLIEKDWDGEAFVVLTYQDRSEGQAFNVVDLTVDDDFDASDPIAKAVYERNAMIKQLFNAEIERVEENNASYDSILANTMSYGTEYSAYMLKIAKSINMAITGDLLDLNSEVSYINLQEDWWDTSTIESLAVKNRAYFALGDINTVDDDATWCVLFNKYLRERYQGLPNFYDMVRDGDWTVENLKYYASKDITDDNGDSSTQRWQLESDYQYGLYFQDECSTVLLQSSGITPFTKDPKNGSLTSNLKSVEMQNAIDTIRENMMLDNTVNQEWALNINRISGYSGGDIWQNIARGGFKANKALFFMCHCGSINLIRDMERDFGILPIPKLSEGQKDYGNTVQYGNATCYSIPFNTPDAEFSGFILEALGYYSSREYSTEDSLKAAYYDVTLQRKATRDDESWDMLDMVFDNRIFDISCAKNTGSINSLVVKATTTTDAWATVMASNSQSIETQIQEDLVRLMTGGGVLK